MGTPSRSALLLGFATIYLVWGSTYLAIRFAIETIPPLTMAGVRYVTAGLILTGWAAAKGAGRPSAAHLKTAFVVGGLLLLCGNGGVVWAEQRIPSGLAALLIAIEPLWIVLLMAVTGEAKPSGRGIAGVALGLLGVVLLVGPEKLGGERVDLLGAAVLVLAALAWAAGSLWGRRAPRPASPLLGTGIQMLAGGGLLLLAGLMAGEWGRLAPAGVTARSALSLLYLVVFGSLLGYTTYVWLLSVASPSRVSTYAFVNPVIAVVLGWLVAEEPLSPRIALAGAVIVGAVVLITLSERSRRA